MNATFSSFLICFCAFVAGLKSEATIMASCSLYFVSCWALFYVLDVPSLNTPHNLRQPSLNDLEENCYPFLKENYVENIIVPARDYFILIKECEKYARSSYNLGVIITVLLPVHCIGKDVVNMRIDTIWKILLCVAIFAVLGFLAYFIYRRSNISLHRMRFTELNHPSCYDYPLDYWHERKKLHGDKSACERNNTLIFAHLSFLRMIYEPIRNRYYTAMVIDVATVLAAFVLFFICR